MDIDLHVIGRILAAAGLGALIGLEREAADQSAGLRTHMTVALGAALFGVISTVGFDEFRTTQRAVNIQYDVTRVASTVVTAVGFLGAGMIFRRGTTVHNLTTAASLWVIAAIGLACGVGDIGPATVTAGILLAALLLLRFPRDWIRHHVTRNDEPVRILLSPGQPDQPVTDALHGLRGVRVLRLSVEKEQGAYVLVGEVEAERGVDLNDRLGDIARRNDVVTMRVGVTPDQE